MLQQLTVPSFDRVVVAIGDDLEASILTTSLLIRFGIQHVWAKAVSDAHGTILEQLGVAHVVYPEKEIGKRVAHLVRGSMQDYLETGDDFALVKAAANQTVSGVLLGEVIFRSKYGVTITAVMKSGSHWSYTNADTVIDAGDLMLFAGPTQKAETFSQFR